MQKDIYFADFDKKDCSEEGKKSFHLKVFSIAFAPSQHCSWKHPHKPVTAGTQHAQGEGRCDHMQGKGRALETTLACAMKMSSYYKRKKHVLKKSSASFPSTRPWEGEMLILQLTDGSLGTSSWFPPCQPHLVLGVDFGGGMKDISLPPARQYQQHCTCHGMKHQLCPQIPPQPWHISHCRRGSCGSSTHIPGN